MDAQTRLSTTLHFTPSLDWQWVWMIAALGLILLVLSFIRYKRGLVMRCVMFGLFILALLNPSLLKEDRNYVKDVAVIVVDQSTSQNFEKRSERTKNALAYVQQKLEGLNAFDVRVINAPKNATLTNRTDLFSALDQTLTDVPQKRRAGVIFLTDGQIHDVPKNETQLKSYGPVHALLSGKKNEKDRQIHVTHASAYGLVGKDITVKYRVEDTKNIGQGRAKVTLTLHDGTQQHYNVVVNREETLTLPILHPGQNVFSLEVEGVSDEITLANNKTAILVNGVRDRLKVLLVSGIPHSGERTWRDLLTSDPGVDLIHFTILREPQKFDYTPKRELSLIAFPFRELFEIKLYDFDLIIFDRYRVNNILPDRYFQNIVKYVREGGAFLEASGPAFASRRSVYDTPLGDILPGSPTGKVTEHKYTPTITELGHQHPVTKNLIWDNKEINFGDKENWGSWLRYINIKPMRGDTLMNGAENSPLLILDRVGEGRVAQISSDHIWLWSRGYQGGGPHAELLRRIVHWLMKEPELDERAMTVRVNQDTITIQKQSYGKTQETIAMTTPDGENLTIDLKADASGLLTHKHKAKNLGIYAFEDTNGTRKFAIIGDLNPPELSGVITTDENLKPLIDASGGTAIWLDDTPKPQISLSKNTRRYGGSNWLAMKQNDDFTVTGVRDIALLPEWMTLLILLSVLLLLWWREGQNR